MKIENIEKVFIVVRRSAKFVKPVRFTLTEYGCDLLAVFPNRKNAEKYVLFFENSPNTFDILERKLA